MTTIREFSDRDIDMLSGMICRIWEMDTYGRGLGIPASRAYLESCMGRSSFIRVLESDGVVMGCVMARSGDQVIDVERDIEVYTSGPLAGAPGLDNLVEDMMILDRADLTLREESDAAFDGELVLLIVSEAGQGRGYGRMLFEEALGYFREQGLSSILIYTDDDCGYGFYDRLGAMCLASKDVHLMNEDLHMMLYRYIVK